MKKEFMASLLTLTAGMASTVTFPQYALARSSQQLAEKAFAKEFRLKLDVPARYTDDKGNVISGHIYLSVEQSRLTPRDQNQLHGEMTGVLIFESDDYTSEYNGRQFKTTMALTGDDGEVLLDLVNKDKKDGNSYQIYGCNSTKTYCEFEQYNVSFGSDSQVTMDLKIRDYRQVEIYVDTQDGKAWQREAYGLHMTPVTAK